MPTAFSSFLSGLVDRELEKYNLYLQSNEARGKGVHVFKAVPEGETILEASCLIFSGWPALLAFLRQHPGQRDAAAGCATSDARFESDKLPFGVVFQAYCSLAQVMRLQGVFQNQVPTTMYCVLFGAARFVNSYHGARTSPNAEWVLNATRGANPGDPAASSIVLCGLISGQCTCLPCRMPQPGCKDAHPLRHQCKV